MAFASYEAAERIGDQYVAMRAVLNGDAVIGYELRIADAEKSIQLHREWQAKQKAKASRSGPGRVIEAGGGVLAVDEGWHDGPTAQPVRDAEQVGLIIERLVSKSRPNVALNGKDFATPWEPPDHPARNARRSTAATAVRFREHPSHEHEAMDLPIKAGVAHLVADARSHIGAGQPDGPVFGAPGPDFSSDSDLIQGWPIRSNRFQRFLSGSCQSRHKIRHRHQRTEARPRSRLDPGRSAGRARFPALLFGGTRCPSRATSLQTL